MPRRTVYLTEAVEEIVRGSADEGESFSATVGRLIEAGSRSLRTRKRSAWIGSGEGPDDLGRRAEYYLKHPVTVRPRARRS